MAEKEQRAASGAPGPQDVGGEKPGRSEATAEPGATRTAAAPGPATAGSAPSPQRRKWRYPDASEHPDEEIYIHAPWCKACGICYAMCPHDVLEADKAGYPVVAHPERCVACYLCEVLCPDMAITVHREPSSKRSSEGPGERASESGGERESGGSGGTARSAREGDNE